jgi:glycosyltransferase involved in cell wall biosynthesis
MNKPKLSIVIPVMNEDKNVEEIHKRMKETLDGKIDYEVVWVDDGSKDNTPNVLERICKENENVHGITLMTNTGQSGALMAGIEIAQGELIATMDGDNQDDPADFLKMVKKLEDENLDAIVGWRKNRWEGNFIRKVPSLIANRLMKMTFGELGIHDTGCMVKVMKADIVKNIKLYGELHRFMSYLLAMYGARLGEIEVNHKERTYGTSHYGFRRTFTVMFDILNVKFLTMKKKTPIQFMGPIALGTLFIGFISAVALILMKIIRGSDITGSPLFMLSILSFIMSFQFVSFGLLGELILRSYYENGGKKVYAVRRKY